jgi:hypothetical protein
VQNLPHHEEHKVHEEKPLKMSKKRVLGLWELIGFSDAFSENDLIKFSVFTLANFIALYKDFRILQEFGSLVFSHIRFYAPNLHSSFKIQH